MKNNGVFQILKYKDKYRIVYLEKGEVIFMFPNEYSFYDEANDYLETNKEKLDNDITNLKLEKQKELERQEEERKTREEEDRKIKEAKELEEKRKKEEKEKKKEERKAKRAERKEEVKTFFGKGWVKFTSGFLVAAMLLTGGHFIGKGISNATKNKDSKKPTTSQTDSTINVTEDKENIISYEEMYNTENFEKMVAEFAKPYVSNGVSLTTEDLLKFATIVNIDRLAEENPEFAKEIFSVQTAEEYLNDAAKTIGMTYMYNHTKWESDKNTDNFIWISSSIPEGDPQKEKMVELEGYVTKIAKASAEKNKEDVNKLTYELIESLTLPDKSLNALDDGVEFGAQVYFALINNSIARNYLNQEYRDYFNTRSSSEQNVSNIFAIYNRCITDAKVRTR